MIDKQRLCGVYNNSEVIKCVYMLKFSYLACHTKYYIIILNLSPCIQSQNG